MEDRKKYFIDLDNIDTDYLPRLKKYLRADNCDKVPLWSVLNASTSFADEICEFELFSKDDKETTTTEYDENSSMEQCHICDTQVPTAYMQKHYTGEKHRVCAAIIRHALRRATQHAECIPFAPTGSTTQPVSLTHSGGTYFCDHCSLAVNVESKGTHEQTKEHRVSVIHDRLLNGLLITYTDKGRVVANSRYEPEVSNESDDVSADEDVSRDDYDVTTALHDDLEDINHNNDVTTTPAILEPTFAPDTFHPKNADKGKQSSDEESDAKSIDSIDVDNSYANRVKLSSNSVTNQANANSQEDATTTNKQELIEIVTVSNDTVKVPAKNYHGISYKLTGGISCLVCQKTIVDIEAHILEPRHEELVSAPVANRNCIRKISAVWNHCIICNKLVQSIPHHVSSSPHQTKLLSLDVTSKKQQRILKRFNKNNYCDVCQCNISKSKMESHLNSVRHAQNLSRTTFTADNHVLHHHFKRDEDKIQCFICNIVVSDDETDAHIVSDGHENNYKTFLVTNHISKLNNKAFYCDCCKQKFRQRVTTEIEHVQNISHKIHNSKVSTNTPKVSIPVNVNSIENFERLDITTTQLLYLLETSNIAKRVTCKVCKHTFKRKSTQIKNHMTKQYHQYNIAALLYVNRIKNNLDGTYFCEVCHSIIDHTKEFDHINSSDHKINLKSESPESSDGDHISKVAETPVEKDSYSQDINVRNARDDVNGNDMSDVAASLAENSTLNVDILNRHVADNPRSNLRPKHSHFKKIKDLIVCLICNVEVRAIEMDAHIKSEEHNNNYKCFFVTNHLTQSKVGYNCHACNLKTSTSEIVHANKKKHKLKIHVYKTKTSPPVDVNSIQDIEFLDRKLLNLLEPSDEHGQVQCKVCKVTMKSHSMQIKEHLAEQYHKFNVDTLLYVNKVKNKHDGTYFCEVCHRTIDHTKEIDHINGNDHIMNTRNIPLSWRQRGDEAPMNPPESRYNREMDVKNISLAYREKGNDMARVVVPLAENTTSNNHHTIDNSKRELHSHLNEIKDDVVCFICNTEVRADDIEAHNERNHNINVRNAVSSWIQISDDMIASKAPSENSFIRYVRNSNDNEINMRNAPVACEGNDSDTSKVAVSSDEYPSSNVSVAFENSERKLDASLEKLIAKIISNVDVRADDIVSDIENNHNISVSNRGDDNEMTGAASENLTSCGENNKIYESDMNVKNATIACGETGDDIAKEAKQTKTYLSYFLENTTSNVEYDHNAVDNSKGELHSNLEKFGDEILRCADDIDSDNENNHNIYVRNRSNENNLVGPAVTPKNLTYSVNAEGTYDHEINAYLACIEKGDDIAMTPAENTTSITLAENSSSNVPIKDGETSHASNRTDNFETTGSSEVQHDSNYDMKGYLSAIPSNCRSLMCQICNAVIPNIEDDIKNHLNGKRHKSKYEKFLDDKNKKDQHDARGETDCDTSRIAVALSENHISNVHILDCKTVDNSERELHYHLKKVQDEIVCSICNIGLCDVDIDAHIESDEHSNNYKTFLVENQITKHQNRFFCYICRCFIKKNMCETEHVKSQTHVDKISVHKPAPSLPVDVNSIPDIEFLENTTSKILYLLESTHEPSKIRCKVCKLIMKCNLVEIKKHMIDQSHKFNMEALHYVNKVKNKSDGTYFCEVCRSIIGHTKEFDHINSIAHKINKASWKDIDNYDIANAAVKSTDNDASNVNVKETLNHIQAVNQKLEMIAQSDVSLQALIEIEDFDKIIPIDSEKYLCECCSVHLVKGTVAEHVEKYYHIINLAKYMHKQKITTSKLKDSNIDNWSSASCKKNVETTNVKLISYKVIDDFKDGETSHTNSSTTLRSAVKNDSKHDINSCLSAVPSKPHEVKCQICNIVVPNTDANKKDHLNGRRHQTNYEMFLVNKTQLKTVENCDINVKVPMAKTTKNDTLTTEAFVNAQAIKSIDNVNSSKVKTDTEHDMKSYLSVVPSKPSEVMCLICNTVVSKNDAHIKVHFNGRRHKSNYEKFLVDKKKQLKIVEEKLASDNNVKVAAAMKTKAQAIKSKENLRSTEVKTDTDMKSYLSVIPSKPNEVMCLICDTVITKNDSNIKEHFKGTRHKTNYKKFLVDKKQLKPVKENVPGDNNVKVPAAAKTTKNYTQKTEALVKAQSIFLKYAEGVLFCRCCNMEVRHTQQDVNIHLSGWKHKVKSSAMLADNGLRVDRNKIYCDVCEVFLPNLDGITHIDSSKHKKTASAKASESVSADKNVTPVVAKTNETDFNNRNISNNIKESTNREQKPMQDNLPEVFCDVCKVRVTNMPVHLNSNQHKLHVNLVNEDITCRVCKLKVNKNDLVQHENSAPHNKNFEDILLKNKISQKWNGVLYCELCDLFFTPVTLMKHVEHENHKKLMVHL